MNGSHEDPAAQDAALANLAASARSPVADLEAIAERATWRAMSTPTARSRPRRLAPWLLAAAVAIAALMFWWRPPDDTSGERLAGGFAVRVAAAEPLTFHFDRELGPGGSFRIVIVQADGSQLPPIVVRAQDWTPDASQRAALGTAATLLVAAMDYQPEEVAATKYQWHGK